MKTKKILVCALLLSVVFSMGIISAKGIGLSQESEKQIRNEDKLVVLWTSGDREVALKMAFMYTFNSKKYGWWDDITLVVWGPSAKLLSEDKELQDYIKRIKDAGIVIKACKGCSDMYGVSKHLEDMGIIVKYMGELTDYLKEGRKILTL